MSKPDDASNEAFALLEVVQMSNGDIVLRDPEADEITNPLLTIQFSPEVRTLLGQGSMRLAKVMIEAAAQQISELIDANDAASAPPDVLH
jgi:hypothetical protein